MILFKYILKILHSKILILKLKGSFVLQMKTIGEEYVIISKQSEGRREKNQKKTEEKIVEAIFFLQSSK